MYNEIASNLLKEHMRARDSVKDYFASLASASVCMYRNKEFFESACNEFIASIEAMKKKLSDAYEGAESLRNHGGFDDV
jgi:hypothetical protein